MAGVRVLKGQTGRCCGASAAPTSCRTLIANRLVDEYRVRMFPLLGTGKGRLGAGTVPDGLEPTRSYTASTNVILTAYRAGAEIKRGSFVPDEVSEEEHLRRAGLEG